MSHWCNPQLNVTKQQLGLKTFMHFIVNAASHYVGVSSVVSYALNCLT